MTHAKNDPAEAILEAALDTILIDKISGARLRQVAKQACMSQGNLHDYYMPAHLASIMDGAALQNLMDAGSLDLQPYFDTAFEMVVGVLSARPG
jgi:hypothetical protein